MGTHGQHRVKHHDALLRPFDQISVVRYVTAQIVVQLLVDVHQGRWDLHIRLHGEAQTVGLTYVVVRVLSQNYHFYL